MTTAEFIEAIKGLSVLELNEHWPGDFFACPPERMDFLDCPEQGIPRKVTWNLAWWNTYYHVCFHDNGYCCLAFLLYVPFTEPLAGHSDKACTGGKRVR